MKTPRIRGGGRPISGPAYRTRTCMQTGTNGTYEYRSIIPAYILHYEKGKASRRRTDTRTGTE
eukprot:scaffold590780_cov14-Prasinocladus_malaysianus.AAC.1